MNRTVNALLPTPPALERQDDPHKGGLRGSHQYLGFDFHATGVLTTEDYRRESAHIEW